MSNERDCPHGRQTGKCDTCDADELEARFERDTALLRQALEALEVLETYMPYYLRDRKRPLITALRERLGEKT